MQLTITVCDKCGKVIQGKNDYVITICKRINKEQFEICQECAFKFKDWMSECCLTEEATND